MALYNNGLQYNVDVWMLEYQQVLSSAQVALRFGLMPSKFAHWDNIHNRISLVGTRVMRQQASSPQPEEWLALYHEVTDLVPLLVFQGKAILEARLNGLCTNIGYFHAMGIPKMQSQKHNFTILQLQDFLVNYGLYEMLISFEFYFRCFFLYVLKI
jgi:hypothetical protein